MNRSPRGPQPGRSLEQLQYESSFLQPSKNRPIIGVARRIGSAMQPIRRANPQLRHIHLAVARELEHPFLHPPTSHNPVMYATKYASHCSNVTGAVDGPVELTDAVWSENLHALSFCAPIHSSSRGKTELSYDARNFRGHVRGWTQRLVVELFSSMGGLRQLQQCYQQKLVLSILSKL